MPANNTDKSLNDGRYQILGTPNIIVPNSVHLERQQMVTRSQL